MPRRVQWTERAIKDLGPLDRITRERIVEAVERFAATGYGDIKRLRDYRGLSRLRVGDWRVICGLEPDLMNVVRVLPRGHAYR